MVSTIKFSQFGAASLTNTTNMTVGITSSSGSGNNIQFPYTASWTTATRPSPAYSGLLGYNSNLTQYEYWNGSVWIQLAAGGSGSVNLGSVNQLAYYQTTGTAVSGLFTANNGILTTSGTGVPSISSTAPVGLTLPQPIIQGVIDGSNAVPGSVGEYISSIILSGSALPILSNTPINVTSISLTAGDWNLEGSVSISNDINDKFTDVGGWISLTSATLPNFALYNNISMAAGFYLAQAGLKVPSLRVNISSTTTVYLSAIARFIAGNAIVCGQIIARRVR